MSRSNTPKKDSEVVTEPEAHDVTAKEGLFAQDDTCTCGKCIRGLLSPRLRFAFKTQAHVLYFMLTPTTNQYSEDGETWINLNEAYLTFVDPKIKLKFLADGAMRAGFVKTFQHIYSCLESGYLPTCENVYLAAEMDSEDLQMDADTDTFVSNGGSVASVVRLIFSLTVEGLCDGTIDDMFGESLDTLPACQNDLNFEGVAEACGIDF